MEDKYVRHKITQGLLELMRENDFHSITVTMIVRRSEVGRASFYRNFDSKEDVIHQHMTRLLKEWSQEYETLGKLEELLPSNT